jgi:hypothetical protein
MPLITCKKCKKIVTAGAESCPYCGEANPGDTRIDLSSKQVNLRNAGIGFFILTLLIILLFQWSSKNDVSDAHGDSVSPIKSSCLSSECPAGTQAVTYTTQQEPFYVCKSSELSEYANYVLSLMIKLDRYGEIAPEISGKTGEPVAHGDDKLLLDKYRAKAGVSSFEEAISKCYRGGGNLKVVVLYSLKDSNSIYVAPEEDRENKFWLPKARLFRK